MVDVLIWAAVLFFGGLLAIVLIGAALALRDSRRPGLWIVHDGSLTTFTTRQAAEHYAARWPDHSLEVAEVWPGRK